MFKCVFLATALTAEMMMGKSLKSAVQLLLKLGPLIQHCIQLCFELARLDSVLCWQLRFSLFFHIKIRGWLPNLDVACQDLPANTSVVFKARLPMPYKLGHRPFPQMVSQISCLQFMMLATIKFSNKGISWCCLLISC